MLLVMAPATAHQKGPTRRQSDYPPKIDNQDATLAGAGTDRATEQLKNPDFSTKIGVFVNLWLIIASWSG